MWRFYTVCMYIVLQVTLQGIHELLTDYDSLMNNSAFSDITVLVGNEETSFLLHRAILYEKSQFFEAALKSGAGAFKEAREGVVKLPDMQADVFKLVLLWIYGSKLDLKTSTRQIVVGAYEAADFLGIRGFRKCITELILHDMHTDNHLPFDEGTAFQWKAGPILEFVFAIFNTATLVEWEEIQAVTTFLVRSDLCGTDDFAKYVKIPTANQVLIGCFAVSNAFAAHSRKMKQTSLCKNCSYRVYQPPFRCSSCPGATS